MSEYKCGFCGYVTKALRDASGTLQCPKCHSKVFFKKRQPVGQKFKAR